MNQLNIARFARLSRWVEWQKYQNGIFIRFPQNHLSLHTLYFVHQGITFKHIQLGMNFTQNSVSYPEGINSQSNVYQFLVDINQPKSVQYTLRNGQKRYLRNQACDADLKLIRSHINNPTSIYGYLSDYLGPEKQQKQGETQQENLSGKINYFLNQFYMRLSAQTYCKLNGIKPTTVIDSNLKNQILNFIGEQYQNHSPAAIRKVYNERDIINRKIEQTKMGIDTIQQQGQRKIKFYKIGAALITATHITTFAYMIFFVDWLGWDIIEPITYSITVAYTLLGIRFYRKYKTDRTGSSIRQILLKMIMKPTKIVELKQLKTRLASQQIELQRIQRRAKLLHNRVNFTTSLADSFSKHANKIV